MASDSLDKLSPHPDFEIYSPDELKDQIREIQTKIEFASSVGGQQEFVGWLLQERRLAEAELRRRNGSGNGLAKEQQAQLWPDLLGAKQLLAMPPDPTRWVWDQCLPLRATSALVAKSYIGKSSFAASLALSVCRGWEFLQRPTQRGKVLYVYLDGPFDELKENLMRAGLSESDDGWIFTYAGKKPEGATKWIEENVRLYDARLVIVDTAQKFFGFKEDRYEEKINKMQPMLDLCDEFNFHAMFTWHAAKNTANTVSALGSVAAEANARVSLYLRKLDESEQRIFETVQNSGKRFDTIGISDPTSGGIIERIGTLWEVQVREIQAKIAELLVSTPGMFEADIMNQVGHRKKTVGMALRKMLDKGELERVRSNPERKNSAFKYYLAGTINEQEQEDEPEKTLFGGNA